MQRFLILLLTFVFSAAASGQGTDILQLKRKGKTVRSFYAGQQVELITKQGAYRNAYINVIKNDTLYLQEFVIRRLPTTIGTVITDTAGSYRFAYHYNDIYSFGPKPQKGFNVKGSGASLVGGGILLMLASGVVYLADRDNFSPALFGGAAGLAGLGFLMNTAGSKGIIIGKKKYSLHYIDMTP